MSLQSNLSTERDLLDDLDEEKEDLLLACLMVREYLSEKSKGHHFTSEKELSWKNSWLSGGSYL